MNSEKKKKCNLCWSSNVKLVGRLTNQSMNAIFCKLRLTQKINKKRVWHSLILKDLQEDEDNATDDGTVLEEGKSNWEQWLEQDGVDRIP
jgi:hypothetical protein